MPELNFEVQGAEPVYHAIAPLLIFKLHVTNSNPDEPIHTIALRAQIQIDVTRRRYETKDHERMLDLFGAPDRWSQTLRAMLWTFSSVIVQPFSESTVVDLPVPCTYDFNIAATKYFYALDNGDVPLTLLFSGTVFYEGEDGALQVGQISWAKEATYKLPVRVWKEMMEHYYPNTATLALRQDVFDRLYRFKARHGTPTWEQVITQLLNQSLEEFEDTTD